MSNPKRKRWRRLIEVLKIDVLTDTLKTVGREGKRALIRESITQFIEVITETITK